MKTQPHSPGTHLEIVSADLNIPTVSSLLTESLASIKTKRRALVLGDPFVATSEKLLMQGKFLRITAVDRDPLLFEERLIPLSNERIDRINSKFLQYEFRPLQFDFIYSEKISVMPVHVVQAILKKIQDALTSTGMFFAVWAGNGDSFHDFRYTPKELTALYKQNGFRLKWVDLPYRAIRGDQKTGGTHHHIVVQAWKK